MRGGIVAGSEIAVELMGESVHIVAPAPDADVPAAHAAHDALPVALAYSPGVHSMHVTEPATDAYDPAAQSAHEAEPGALAYVPTAHVAHVELPVALA